MFTSFKIAIQLSFLMFIFKSYLHVKIIEILPETGTMLIKKLLSFTLKYTTSQTLWNWE